MKPRTRRLLWGLFIALVGVGLFAAYKHFILDAPTATIKWVRHGVTYEFLQPRTIGILLVAPLLLFVLGRSLADLPWQQRVLSVLLRIAFIGLLAFGLARLARTAETQKVCTVFLMDVSDSVQNASIEDARKQVEQALKAKKKDDLVKLVTFARRPRLVELKDKDGKLVVPPVARLRHVKPEERNDPVDPGAGSDLQAALQLAYGVFPPGYLKHAVLMSDGVETNGDVLAEANRARGFGVKLFAVPYRRPPPGEVAVKTLHLPDKVDIGQPFDITADIYASRSEKAHARLYQGVTLNGLDSVRDLDLKPGNNEVKFKSVVRVGGPVTYSLKLDHITSDKFKQNNSYSATLDVPGRPAVLYVEGQPSRASYLTSALSAQQFDVDVRAPTAFPASLKELERYDFVILSDVPKEQVSLASQDLIEKYVRDLGGGFLFAGGENGYGLGGWAHTTIERILPVRMDAQRRKDMPSVAMVLVIDRSGSMNGLPIEMAKAACKATVGTLQGDDLIEVIAFDSTPVRYVKMGPARYRSRIQNDIARIQAGGGTEIFPALDMAYQDISVVQARKKHVILLTDGRAPSQGIKDLVQAMIAESITVTTVGLGDGADGDLLRMIAETGGGRYHAVPDPNSLPKIFTRETELIARQAAVEDWFPVQQVAPADFLKGIAINSAPLLHGYVATQMKGPPAQLDPRQRSRRADSGALEGRARHHAGLDQRREEPMGRRLAALARLQQVLGPAGARQHAQEAAPRAGHEDRGGRRRCARHGRRLHYGRTLRQRHGVEAHHQGAGAGGRPSRSRHEADRAGPLPGRIPAGQVRFLPAAGPTLQARQERQPEADCRQLRTHLEPVSARVRELRTRRGSSAARGAGRWRQPRPDAEGHLRPRQGQDRLPQGTAEPLHPGGDPGVPARPVDPARAHLRPQVPAQASPAPRGVAPAFTARRTAGRSPACRMPRALRVARAPST